MQRTDVSLAAAIVLAGLVLTGCNLITGSDNLVLAGRDDAAGEDGASSSPIDPSDDGSGNGSGAGLPGAGGGNDGGPVGAGGGGPTAPALTGANGVMLTDVIIYQGVSRPVMDNGAPVAAGAPIVEGRDALWRLFYQTDGAYDGGNVVARLSIDGLPPLELETTVSGSSSEGAMGSTLNFNVPGAMMTSGMSYRVDVLQPDVGQADYPASSYPAVGSAAVPVQAIGTLKITLVPVRYDADGSGRLPDTSQGQLDGYRDLFYSIYPVADVEINVRGGVFAWNNTTSANGGGWDTLLNAIAQLRSSDGVPSDEYYYGIFEPAGSFGAYCSGGCVAGLGFLGSPTDDYSHSAIGLGFSGASARETAVHELGHNHGREHAPCGVSGDPLYPYDDGSIGVYGYDLLTGQLKSPGEFVDMMSYCNPIWISDHNFEKIFNRIKAVGNAQIVTPAELLNQSYERVMLHPDGTTSWLDPIVLERPPLGDAIDVDVATTSGSEQVTGQLLRYDHIAGGVLFVPPTNSMRAPGGALSTVVDDKLIVMSL